MNSDQFFSNFHFLRPWWLLVCLAIPVLYLLIRIFQKSKSGWDTVISPELLKVLLPNHETVKVSRWIDVSIMFALIMASVAMAGPSWERIPQPAIPRGDDLVIILDLSGSMYAEDVSPSRLGRAKQKITDILLARQEGHTALVVYAGDAHVVTPLTDDTNTILHLLEEVEPNMMPLLGSNTSDGLNLGWSLLENGASKTGRVLLITDGIDESASFEIPRGVQAQIHVIGVGTLEGAPIPFPDFEGEISYLRDANQNLVIARLQPDLLRKRSQEFNAIYQPLSIDDSDVEKFFSGNWNQSLVNDQEDGRTYDTWYDNGYLLLIPLTLLALIALRKNVLVVILIFVAADTHANWFENLWKNSDQRAHDQLLEGNHQKAEELFEDPSWKAVSKYRGQKFDEASEMFLDQDTLTSTYNLGNALAYSNLIEDAIAAYDEVLTIQPDHEDARFNRDLLASHLQQLQQNTESLETPNEELEEEQDEPQSGEGEPEEPEADEQEPGQEPTDNAQPEDMGENNQNQQREEDDTMERILRRVPDDPGALLANKFRYETRRRLERGELTRQRSRKTW